MREHTAGRQTAGRHAVMAETEKLERRINKRLVHRRQLDLRGNSARWQEELRISCLWSVRISWLNFMETPEYLAPSGHPGEAVSVFAGDEELIVYMDPSMWIRCTEDCAASQTHPSKFRRCIFL